MCARPRRRVAATGCWCRANANSPPKRATGAEGIPVEEGVWIQLVQVAQEAGVEVET